MAYSGPNLNHGTAAVHLMIKTRNNFRGFTAANRHLKKMRGELENTSSISKRAAKRVEMGFVKMKMAVNRLRTNLLALRSVALKAFAALVAFNSISFGAFSILEREMMNVQTMMDGTVEKTNEMREEMTDAIMDISNTMGESARELSEGLYKVLSLGVDEDLAIPAVQQLEKAAKAGKATLEESTTAAISTINALGLEMDDLTNVLNVQFETIREGNTTYSDLSKSLQNVLPAAMRVGAEMDELYGSMAFLTKVSMEPRRAATALSRTFETLSQKSGNLSYKLENTFAEIEDIQLYDAQGEMKSFYNIMKQIATQTDDMPTQKLQQVWKEMGLSKRASRGMVPIIERFDLFSDIIKKTGKASQDGAGTMDEAFNKIRQSGTFQMKQTVETFKNTFATLGRIMKPTIIPILENFQAWLSTVQKLMEANDELVVNFMVNMGKLLKNSMVLLTVGATFLGLINPITQVITVLSLFAAAWYTNLNGIRDKIQNFIDYIYSLSDTLKNMDLLSKLTLGISSLAFTWLVGVPLLTALAKWLASKFFFTFIPKAGTLLAGVINGALTLAITTLEISWIVGKGLLTIIGQKIATLFGGAVSLGGLATGAGYAAGGAALAITGLTIGIGLGVAFDEEVDGVKEWWDKFIDTVKVFANPSNWSYIFSETWDGVKTVANNFWDKFIETGKEVLGQMNPLNWFGGKQKHKDLFPGPSENTNQQELVEGGGMEKHWLTELTNPILEKIKPNKYFNGGIIPGGKSHKDNRLAMVASGEAVVPNYVVSKGPDAVLEWFREQGVPGFFDGKKPQIDMYGKTQDEYIKDTPNLNLAALSDLNGLMTDLNTSMGDLRSILGDGAGEVIDYFKENAEDTENLNKLLSVVDVVKSIKNNLNTGIKDSKKKLEEQIKKQQEQIKSQQEGTITNQKALDMLQESVESGLKSGDSTTEMMDSLGMSMLDEFTTQISNQFKNSFEKDISDLMGQSIGNPEKEKPELQYDNDPFKRFVEGSIPEIIDPIAKGQEKSNKMREEYDKYQEKLINKAEWLNQLEVISDQKLEEIKTKFDENNKDNKDIIGSLEGVMGDLQSFTDNLSNLGIGGSGLEDLSSGIGSIMDGMDMMKELTSESGLKGSLSKLAGSLGKDSILGGLTQSASGMLGKLSSAAGPIGAAIGAGSFIKDMNESENEELKKQYENQIELNQDQLEALKTVEDNTKETANNIVRAVSENPTTDNIEIAGSNLEDQITMLEEAKPDFGSINITGIDQDRWWHGEDRVLDKLSPIRALEKAGGDLSELDLTKQFEEMRTGPDSTREIFAGYEESLNDLSPEKLKEFNKEFQELSEQDMKDIASKGIDKEFETNLEGIQDQVESYVDTLTELKETRDELTYESRMESFEGINYLDKEEAVKNYKEQLIETYEAAGYSDKEIDEMSSKIKNMAKDMAETTDSEVTAMQDVRDGFQQAFTDGDNMIESFSQGLESYFSKLKNNISGLLYDIELSSLNKDFKELFKDMNEQLANLGEGENPLDKIKEYLSDDTITSSEKIANLEVMDYDPKSQLYELSTGSPLDSIFKDMQELEDKQQNMDTIVDVIRDKAKEAGISKDIIDNMLPATEASEKAKEIADNIEETVSGALQDAFDDMGNFNYLDMTKSLGQSVYDSVKDSMIDAFKDSKIYEERLKEFFKEDQFKEDIQGMSMREIGQHMEEQLKGVDKTLRKEGLDRIAEQVQTEVQDTESSESSESTEDSDYYGGADTSGEGGNITNNHYHFSPNIENSYGDTKEDLFKEFVKYKKQLDKEEA